MIKNNYFTRGMSLKEDFGRLINDERFYDISLKCSDEKFVFGCKAILETRSDVFKELISERSELSFDNINSNAMKAILQYLYTSEVKGLTVENVIEIYHASIHFTLLNLQKDIINRTMMLLKSEHKDIGKKLLTQYVKKFNTSLKTNNEMSEILVDWVAKDKLREHEIYSLSLEGLKYLLMKTFFTKKPFATSEIEVWKYVLMKAKREFEQNQVPTSKKISNKKSVYSQQEIEGIKSYLIPFISFIELNRMDAKEIKEHVEPFNVFLVEKVKDVYYSKTQDEGLGFIRGVPIFRWKNTGFEKVRLIEITTKKPILKSITGDLIFKGKGVYKWDILIKKLCGIVYIGICDIDEELNKPDQKCHGWVLGSDGYVYHKNEYKWYDAKFKEEDTVTVHLDMRDMRMKFSVNNNEKPIVSEWKDIPSQVYPIVSFLERGSELRIEPHMT